MGGGGYFYPFGKAARRASLLDRELDLIQNDIRYNKARRRQAIRQQQESINAVIDIANRIMSTESEQQSSDKKLSTANLVCCSSSGNESNSRALSSVSDVKIDEEKFQVVLDVPGFDVSDIEIQIEDATKLMVSGQHKSSAAEGNIQKFSRSWSFTSAPIDVEGTEAELKNGVLTITVPKDMKRIEERTQNIPVLLASSVEEAPTDSGDVHLSRAQDGAAKPFQITLDVPGVEVSNISVSIEDEEVLIVHGERFLFGKEQGRKFERKWIVADKHAAVPLDFKNASAWLKNGVLTVAIPNDLKKIEDRTRIIPVEQHNNTSHHHGEFDADKNENFHVVLDVPGIEADDIQVRIEDEGKTLCIEGERKFGRENQNSRKFAKSWSLESAPVVAGDATARLMNGVLRVTIPKDMEKLAAKNRKILVRAAISGSSTVVESTNDSGNQ